MSVEVARPVPRVSETENTAVTADVSRPARRDGVRSALFREWLPVYGGSVRDAAAGARSGGAW